MPRQTETDQIKQPVKLFADIRETSPADEASKIKGAHLEKLKVEVNKT